MFKKSSEKSLIGSRVYFRERRGSNKDAKYYSGTVIGFKRVLRTKKDFFSNEKTEWADTSLLIETSDHRKVQAYELDTFEADA